MFLLYFVLVSLGDLSAPALKPGFYGTLFYAQDIADFRALNPSM